MVTRYMLSLKSLFYLYSYSNSIIYLKNFFKEIVFTRFRNSNEQYAGK